MHAMDFYITKYQGKMMQSMTPLFAAMTQGVRKLEEQERKAAELLEKDAAEEPARKKRRTKEDLQRIARQKCIRLASMANRCYWLSSAEIAVFVSTGGDTIETHRHTRIFTRQLQWVIQECKRLLNGDPATATAADNAETAELGATKLSVRLVKAATSETAGASQPGGSEDFAQEDDDEEVGAEIVNTELNTTTTNIADDYAHRGPKLRGMPYYVYQMHVSRRGLQAQKKMENELNELVPYDEHYALSKNYIQVVGPHVSVPTIEGFQCPSWEQDSEQNSLLKHILFNPWCCNNAMDCGSHKKFTHFLSNGDAPQIGAADPDTIPPPPPSTGARRPRRRYTLARAWRLRRAEILVAADRAEERQQAAQKYLTLADSTFWSSRAAEKEDLDTGHEMALCLLQWHRNKCRTLAAEPLRRILAFADHVCYMHEEQCTLAEYASLVARDVMAHLDLAAEARKKDPKPKDLQANAQSEDEQSEEDGEKRPGISIVDVGNAGWEDVDNTTVEADTSTTISVFPLTGHEQALRSAFQADVLEDIAKKKRLSDVDKHYQRLNKLYGPLLQSLDFSMDITVGAPQPGTVGAPQPGTKAHGIFLGENADYHLALQKVNLQAARRQASGVLESANEDADEAFEGAFGPKALEEVAVVPLPDASLGPGHVALNLLRKAHATEEQIDAVSLLALSMQHRFHNRLDRSSVRLPLATATGNHEALWLGGGGVGKTRTLKEVVEPLAVCYFGPSGYLPTAQANQAAQQLGPRGRTIHSVNGLLATSSLVTSRLALNDNSRKKLDRTKGEVGVEATDELGCVQAELLHADCLRTSYGRALRYKLDSTLYMQPQEKWGRMPARILSGDFLQLPPVPPTASLLAPSTRQSYEHQQGVALLASVPYVIDFVEMKRFEDEKQLQLLKNMRVPGGRPVAEETWRAILATECKPKNVTARLLQCTDWYETAYDWRTVSFAMQTKARLQAKQAGQILFYIQAVDKVAQHVPSTEFLKIVAEPNLSHTKKLAGVLPAFIGMNMTMQSNLLPPRYVTGTVGKLVGIELHPDEPNRKALWERASVRESGCFLLKFMPKCFYFQIPSADDGFLLSPDVHAPQLNAKVIAIEPERRTWTHKTEDGIKVEVSRRQIPLLPDKISTLHGIQGKTADPGMCAHWKFPTNLSPEALWLTHYVILSRPRSLSNLVSFGLPSRKVLESGPPQAIIDTFERLFGDRIASTKEACIAARRELGWPARDNP